MQSVAVWGNPRQRAPGVDTVCVRRHGGLTVDEISDQPHPGVLTLI